MQILLENVKMVRPILEEAEAYRPGDKEWFSAIFLIPKGSKLEHDMMICLQETTSQAWGAEAEKVVQGIFSRGVSPVKDGDDGPSEKYEECTGQRIVRAKNQRRPHLALRSGSGAMPDDFPAGCLVNAIINFYAGSHGGSKYLSCYLQGMQFVSSGEKSVCFQPRGDVSFRPLDEEPLSPPGPKLWPPF